MLNTTLFVLLSISMFVLPVTKPLQTQPYDLLIKGGRIVDGSGRAGYVADVAVKGDRIAAIGNLSKATAARVIDAQGLVLAPGFIDAHNHSERGFQTDASAASQVSQGITTVVVGQDGGSPFPVGSFLDNLDQKPIALNVLTFVGHATLRSHVMGEDTNRLATPAEIEKMKQLVEQAMRERKRGTLKSGRSGKKVKSRKQAIAIGLAQARREGAKVPRKKTSKRKK